MAGRQRRVRNQSGRGVLRTARSAKGALERALDPDKPKRDAPTGEAGYLGKKARKERLEKIRKKHKGQLKYTKEGKAYRA